MIKICHITPTVPPAINGVGDYAHRLWNAWPEAALHQVLVLHEEQAGSAATLGVQEIRTVKKNAESLSRQLIRLDPDLVMLHYVPHAYHPKGVPTWLAKGLGKWKRSGKGRLFVVFHETFAFGPVFSTSWLLYPWAIRVFRKIVGLSDGWVTSTQHYYDEICQIGQGSETQGSIVTVGPNIVPHHAITREREMPSEGSSLTVVVFGSAGSRFAALSEHRDLLHKLVESNRLGRLLIVGSSRRAEDVESAATLIRSIGEAQFVEEAFDRPPEEVSQWLEAGDLALISMPAKHLGKSGVYAACVAHGLVCIHPGDRDLTPEVWQRRESALTWPEIAAKILGQARKACGAGG